MRKKEIEYLDAKCNDHAWKLKSNDIVMAIEQHREVIASLKKEIQNFKRKSSKNSTNLVRINNSSQNEAYSDWDRVMKMINKSKHEIEEYKDKMARTELKIEK